MTIKGTILFICILGLVGSLNAGTFHCSKNVPLYNPVDPAHKLEDVPAGTELEVSNSINDHGFVSAIYSKSDGTMVNALCRPEDVGENLVSGRAH